MRGGKKLNSVILYCCFAGWLCMGRRETQNKTEFVAAAVAGTCYGECHLRFADRFMFCVINILNIC